MTMTLVKLVFRLLLDTMSTYVFAGIILESGPRSVLNATLNSQKVHEKLCNASK